jgi:hypothetical protein
MRIRGCSLKTTKVVIGLGWVFVLLASTITPAQTNPVPLIYQPLVPMSTAPGGPQFILTVNGSNFVSGATVNWNRTALATTFVSPSQLTATVPADDLVAASSASVTVTNPTAGGGTSNIEYFTVTNPETAFDLFGSVLPVNVGPPATNTPGPDYGVVAGDFNGDGKLDLVYLNTSNSTIVVLLGNGDGTFQTAQIFPVGSAATAGATALVAADINGDGKLDLAVPDNAGNAIDILLGNGDGTFQTQIVAPTASLPLSIAIGDFNRDGKLDLAVGTGATGAITSGGVSVLLGNGDGTFQSHTDYGINTCTHDAFDFPASVSAITVGDFNNDGILDIVGGATSGYVCYGFIFFPGNGDGTFGPWQNSGYTPSATSLVALGAPPALGVTLGQSSPGACTWCWVFAIFTGHGDGTFEPDQSSTAVGSSLAIGDFSGDGYLDVAFSDSSEPYGCNSGNFFCLIQIYLGSQSGTFKSASISFIPTLQQTVGMVARDFNNDGKMDFATTGNNQVEILMQGTSPFATISPSSLSNSTPVRVGTTSPLGGATLTNGETPLTISSIAIHGPNASDFSQTNTCGSGLGPNATCGINISFTPTADGTRKATLNVYDNAQGSPQTVSLMGVGGVPPSTVSFSPLSLRFPNQYVGTSGLPQNVIVTNNGTGPLNISSVTTSVADFGALSNCTNSVPPGMNCTIGVFFDPTTSGVRNGTLIVTDNASDSPQSVPLGGAGQDFSMTSGSSQSSATVSPGQTARYTVSVTPDGGFNQIVALSCSGAPAQSTCSVSPSSVALNGSTSATATVTVTTGGGSAGLTLPGSAPATGSRLGVWLMLSGMLGLPMMVRLAGRRRERRQQWIFGLFFLCVLTVVIMSACGGGNSSMGGGTKAGTYTLTVKGSFNSGSTMLIRNTKLTLVVQ